ncbi:hypothetical protein [Streptomyces abikoensis]|uniref:hypothetical protein n=1 Tax=Streptomyces abikoensis TaxID=97398 RepID=UPI00167929CD|nr:hypothetical protein [Streptomyces abikoensis]GGP59691.1 hypothetical protein GCM10010214_36510 [Streptomyces abikoensis]
MSALSPRRRSALRAAITTAALAGAVLAPATAAFAAEPAAPAAPAAPVAPAAKAAEAVTKSVTEPTAPTTPAKPAGETAPKTKAADETAKQTGTSAKTAADKQTGTPAKTGAEKKDSGEKTTAEELVGTHDLRDGAVIRVYRIGPNHHQGRIARGRAAGAAAAIVDADGKTGSVMYNDQLIKVNPTDGSVEVLNDKGGGGQGHVAPARYAGNAVYIGNGMVAVLRNDPDAGGPEVWIRAVGEQWKPGDNYMVRVVGGLDRDNTSAVIMGLQLRLVDAYGSAPVLEVRGDGGTRTFALPKGQPGGKKNTTTPPGADRAECTVHAEAGVSMGNMSVELINSPRGPKAVFTSHEGGVERPYQVLTRDLAVMPKNSIFIRDADTATPKLVDMGYGTAHVTDFPKMPAGCGTSGDSADKGTAAVGGTGTQAKAVNASAQLAQTKAIPQGGVAAGAEGVDDGNGTLLLAAGGALASVSAAGVAFAVLRRRVAGSAA